MAQRRSEKRQNSYICGQCKLEILYLVGEEPPVPCPECGLDLHSTAWRRKGRDRYDVPSEIKLDLSKY